MWLALPPGETPGVIDSALDGPAAILELGSGPGRVTHSLLAMGHRVTAVDESAEMLAYVTGAETWWQISTHWSWAGGSMQWLPAAT